MRKYIVLFLTAALVAAVPLSADVHAESMAEEVLEEELTDEPGNAETEIHDVIEDITENAEDITENTEDISGEALQNQEEETIIDEPQELFEGEDTEEEGLLYAQDTYTSNLVDASARGHNADDDYYSEVHVRPNDSVTLYADIQARDSSRVYVDWYVNEELVEEKEVASNGGASYTLSAPDMQTYVTAEVYDDYGEWIALEYCVCIDDLVISQREATFTGCPGQKVTLKANVSASNPKKVYFVWCDDDSSYYGSGEGMSTLEFAFLDKTTDMICMAEDTYGNVGFVTFHLISRAHQWSNWCVEKEPTVFEEGYRYRICSLCSNRDEVSELLKPILSFSKKTIVLLPGESSAIYYTVAKGDSIARIVPTRPEIVTASIKENTSTNGRLILNSGNIGVSTVALRTAAGKVDKIKVVVSEDGHYWNSGTVLTPATIYSEGEKELTCQVCGEKKRVSTAVLKPFVKFSSTEVNLERGDCTTVTVSVANGDSIVRVVPTNEKIVKAQLNGNKLTLFAQNKKGSSTVAVRTEAGKVNKMKVIVE